MNKVVYKITNNINGKVYIGQTNNLKRRIQEHKYDKRNSHPIHKAIKEYGFENFSVDILYEGEDYNNKEREYIKIYNSQDENFGYNIICENHGEDSPTSKLTDKLADNIRIDLIYSDLSLSEIANKYDIPIYFVNHINHGESYSKRFETTFPLRRRKSNSSFNNCCK